MAMVRAEGIENTSESAQKPRGCRPPQQYNPAIGGKSAAAFNPCLPRFTLAVLWSDAANDEGPQVKTKNTHQPTEQVSRGELAMRPQARSYLDDHNILNFVERVLRTLVQETSESQSVVEGHRTAKQISPPSQDRPADPWGRGLRA